MQGQAAGASGVTELVKQGGTVGGGGGNAEGGEAPGTEISGIHRPGMLLAQFKESIAGNCMPCQPTCEDAESIAIGQPNWRNVSATPIAGSGLVDGSDMLMFPDSGPCEAASVQIGGERLNESTLSSITIEAGADLALR